MNNTPLTALGYNMLKDELHRLKTIDRPEVIQAISEARAQGDLSENAEYDAAKEKQGFIEGRILELESKLSTALVIDPSSLEKDGRVVFGVWIKLIDLDNEENFVYQIVGDDEADIKHSKISVSSPIARALIGKMEGDVAEFTVPSGVREVEILQVVYADPKTI
ncbi:MAG: transcription elongation factor GreA [Betaproteobacteria bacterium TMED156]|nr:MAG: transcription elongation factor GreA [Betaproteobacteria bacterium TMED156]|tara:strand:+ start:765 stop:1256 length:492 start_codon:yes stop_codon:yes gene_type:complete